MTRIVFYGLLILTVSSTACSMPAYTKAAQQAQPFTDGSRGSFDRTLNVQGTVDLDVSTGSGSIAVRQGPNGRAVLRPFLKESRVAVLDKAEVEFLEIQPDAEREHHERLTLVIQVKQGTVMAEMKQGDPRHEIINRAETRHRKKSIHLKFSPRAAQPRKTQRIIWVQQHTANISQPADEKGRYALDASGNWRITFRWDGEDAIEVDLEDPEVVRALARVQVWPLTRAIAVASTRLDVRGDPADELIAATSLVHNVPLLTRDKALLRSKRIPLARL